MNDLQSETLDWYQRSRARSRDLFDLLTDEAYYSQPIALRHPIVFYEGHLPGFSFNALIKRALGRPSVDAGLEDLFARGIDPHESSAGQGPTANPESLWPSRATVRAFAADADRRIEDALRSGDLDRPGHPLLDRAEAPFCIIEHEALHHETLMYMWHRLPFALKRRPPGYRPRTEGISPPVEWIDVPAGLATLGVDRDAIRFGWDNEFPAYAEEVAAFAIERHDVTNGRFLEFVEAGGYRDERWWTPAGWQWVQQEGVSHPLFWERDGDGWRWRGMFESLPLPLAWPVYVSQEEAAAFARWSGARLPTEAEFQRAAYGSPDGERQHPWGSSEPSPEHGVFDFSSWDPWPVGSHPAGASAWGVEDLVGNGWEWTSTPFGPFPGFRAMASYPEYSADFFDNQHIVMKGASPATARELLRPTFRNWFRTRYPYVYATFRCVKTAPASSQFAEDVAYYLTLTPRQLPSEHLYGELGSALFEAICRLPWYPITRAEHRLLECRARDVFSHVDPLSTLVELGPGGGLKLATLLSARPDRPMTVHLVDVSRAALDAAGLVLASYTDLVVVPHEATYETGLAEVARTGRASGRTLTLFLGSNVGNFDPPGADAFLAGLRGAMAAGDSLLLGADLLKPESELLLAYDDPLGVTAAFNMNLLVRANRELDADFNLGGFAHRAIWNADASRIEMHLVSARQQRVRVPAADLDITFEAGETIWTESSYKYRADHLVTMLERAGFLTTDQWTEDGFALTLAAAH